MTKRLVIAGGRVVDPGQGLNEIADVVIESSHVAGVERLAERQTADELIDAAGKIVTPAWIDMHVHFRDPGQPEKETLETGARAAVAGGFGTVACMPNTSPALDSVEIIREVIARAAREAACTVLPIATITRERLGKEAVDFDGLVGAGAIGFSDDGDTTTDSAIMCEALTASKRLDVPVIVHCEDKAIATGSMHEGDVSKALGLTGIPAAAEEIIIARDLMLAELTGGWLHVCHVSTERGIELIAEAKARGVRVTAEVMPHHLVMSDAWVAGLRTLHNTTVSPSALQSPAHPYTKVNPPLRPVSDTVGLLNAVQRGAFDMFGTDHAPHADPEKLGQSFQDAAFGMTGLEVAFACTHELVRAGHLSLSELVRLWTDAPARAFGVNRGTLVSDSVADVTVWDPDEEWVVGRQTLHGKSINTPLLGMTLRGRAVHTIIDGKVVHSA